MENIKRINTMTKKEMEVLSKKIMKGLKLSFKRLVEQKAKDDEELIFSRNGKIVVIKAKKLLKSV